jgi:Ni/Co efflux regulator RcnB
MKKVLLVLALVAVYGVSMATTQAPVVSIDDQVAVVADVINNVDTDKEKEKKATKSEAKSEAKGCSGEKSAKSEGCAGEKSAKKGEGCDTKKTAEAKSGGCGGK